MIKAGGSDNSKDAYRFVEKASWDAIRRVTVYFWSQCQQTLNVSNPRPYDSPSAAGEPPRKRTGFLSANVVYELDEAKQVGRVGVLKNAIYGLFLEVGTKFMKARPWLLSTLKKVWPQLKEMAKGSAK